jgi:outer membrane cobalamin receptor
MCSPYLLAAQQPPDPQTPPEPVHTTITVVEHISAETPANVTVVDTQALAQTPGTNLDDRLRDIPGFSLYKRSSSLVANPTTQGISLRGIGSSGASRTLVLWDSIPANDVFGGWIYWTQLIPDEMERVEVSRGAATSVFGDRAMSGAIGLFSRPRDSWRLLGDYQSGNDNTQDVTLGFTNTWRNFAFSGFARAYSTDGYYIVPASIRGAVDRKAADRFATGDVHIDHHSSFGDLFFKINLLAEERPNGTALTYNSTSLGTVSLHYEKDFVRDSVSVLGYDTQEGFHSSFSSVTNNRNTEKVTYLQSVPSEGAGGAAYWRHHESRWNLLAGADLDRVHGVSTDHLAPSGLRVGGGTQWQQGVFGQADATLGPVRFFAGLRHSFTGQGNRFLSPNAGLTAGKKSLRLRGSVYRAFRSPTLNELYREFRVGNTDTQPNANLRPETEFGAEAGADWVGETGSIRVTAFRNSLENLITNVTLSSTPSLIVRQRQNAAAAISRGVEADFHKSLGHWSGDLKYLFVDSRYVTGFRVSQIPKHQGTGQVSYRRGGSLVSLGARSIDYQFDDDLNQFRLPGYATVQLAAVQHLVKSLSAEVALENALNRVFYTAFTPTPNIGAPRLWRIGLKWDGRLK